MAEKLDYTNPCPRCGDAAMPEKYRVLGCKMNYACESMVSTEGLFIAGRPCLLRQLAAANERVGRLEAEFKKARCAWFGREMTRFSDGSIRCAFDPEEGFTLNEYFEGGA